MRRISLRSSSMSDSSSKLSCMLISGSIYVSEPVLLLLMTIPGTLRLCVLYTASTLRSFKYASPVSPKKPLPAHSRIAFAKFLAILRRTITIPSRMLFNSGDASSRTFHLLSNTCITRSGMKVLNSISCTMACNSLHASSIPSNACRISLTRIFAL